MGGQFLGLGEAYIPNLSLLVCLEAFKKFGVGWGGVVVVKVVGWSRPVLGFSFSQAEQFKGQKHQLLHQAENS